MVRIALFSNQFAAREGHGIKRYSTELMAALREQDGINVRPVAGWSSLEQDDLRELKKTSGLELTGLGRRGTSLLWTFLGQPRLETLLPNAVDVVHAASLGYPIATRKPYVVTVHDLGPLTHPEYFTNTRPWVMERSLNQAVQQAAAIVCVSQSTANEVRDYAGSAVNDRLHVVHEGVDRAFFEPVDRACLQGLNLPTIDVPFVLCAGKISPRKNVEAVVAAMAQVAGDIPHSLVLVGGHGWDTETIGSAIAKAGIGGRVHQVGFVSDLQLRALYQSAAVYVHPSLYEGFGLTVLEAMASGTPVITSNATSLPEVAGGAAVLVDPHAVSDIADELLAVCGDAGNADALRRAGLERAASFRWSDAGSRMADIYRTVAG